MKHKQYNLWYVIAILACYVCTMHAQVPRYSFPQTFSGYSRTAVDTLITAPPYSGMPDSVMRGYLYIDSTCKHTTAYEIDTLLSKVYDYHDTLRKLMRYFYYVSDYNPVLWEQYNWYGNHLVKYNYAPEFLEAVGLKHLSAIRDTGYQQQRALIHADGIFHIKITSITNDSNTYGGFFATPGHGSAIKTITAKILDTIKGQNWLAFACPPGSGGPTVQTIYNCVQFSFDSLVPVCIIGDQIYTDTNHRVADLQNGGYLKRYGDYTWTEGGEYIVFLSLYPKDYDGSHDYFGVIPQANLDPQGGIYPIVGGLVQDNTNFWGAGPTPTVSVFESAVDTMVTKLLQP